MTARSRHAFRLSLAHSDSQSLTPPHLPSFLGLPGVPGPYRCMYCVCTYVHTWHMEDHLWAASVAKLAIENHLSISVTRIFAKYRYAYPYAVLHTRRLTSYILIVILHFYPKCLSALLKGPPNNKYASRRSLPLLQVRTSIRLGQRNLVSLCRIWVSGSRTRFASLSCRVQDSRVQTTDTAYINTVNYN